MLTCHKPLFMAVLKEIKKILPDKGLAATDIYLKHLKGREFINEPNAFRCGQFIFEASPEPERQ